MESEQEKKHSKLLFFIKSTKSALGMLFIIIDFNIRPLMANLVIFEKKKKRNWYKIAFEPNETLTITMSSPYFNGRMKEFYCNKKKVNQLKKAAFELKTNTQINWLCQLITSFEWYIFVAFTQTTIHPLYDFQLIVMPHSKKAYQQFQCVSVFVCSPMLFTAGINISVCAFVFCSKLFRHSKNISTITCSSQAKCETKIQSQWDFKLKLKRKFWN